MASSYSIPKIEGIYCKMTQSLEQRKRDALEALSKIENGGNVTGCYETIREALQAAEQPQREGCMTMEKEVIKPIEDVSNKLTVLSYTAEHQDQKCLYALMAGRLIRALQFLPTPPKGQ